MCGGVEYTHKGSVIRTYFPNPKAQLPVRTKDGDVELVGWGRRKEQAGQLPMGGWARLESIDKGIWNKWSPKPVKILVDQFMEKDNQKVSHWFKLNDNQWIQGLMAYFDDERRVYVVTVKPENEQAVHDRWPRVMTNSN